MRNRSVTGCLLLLAGILLAALSGYGQVVNGSIVGTITDSSGGVIPNVAITVREVNTGLSRELTTDSSGYYTVPQLPPGTYSVSAEKPGFSSDTHTGVTLHADTTARVDMTLQTGTVTERVTVSAASAPVLQTDTAQTGGSLDLRQVADLPLDTGHNFQTLVSILPGAGTAVRNNSVFYNPENSVTTAVNGFPGRANHFNIEGVSDNEVGGLIQAFIPSSEAIQEVNISTSNYDPAEGGALGAVTNVILKSGTNQFHGEAYEFYNGNKLNARNFFAQGVNGPYQSPHSVDNLYGANVGGPIQKDKTFFFVNYSGHPQRTGYFYNLTVPTVAMRNGNFSDPALTTIYDPATGDSADCLLAGNANLCGTGRQPFPDNIIPASRLDAVAQNLLTYVSPPNANLGGPGLQQYENNYLTSSELIRDSSEIDVKIDRNIGQTNLVSGRFGYAYPTESQPGAFGVYGGPIASGGIGGVEGTGSKRTFSDGINWVHTFSPTLLSEARIGLIRFRDVAHQIGYGQDLSTQVGIPGANVDSFTSGLSSINISGMSDPLLGIFNSFPWELAQTNIDFINNWTKTFGGHTLQWGLDYHRIRDDYLIAPTWPMGGFNFTAGPTSLNGGSLEGGFANAFASFLLGISNSTSRGYSYIRPAYRQNYIFPYVGDKWQVSPKLTLNYGLRWEYYGPPTPKYAGGFSDYDPTDNTLRLAGLGSTPRDLGATNYYHNFAPRAGVAYRLTHDSVVRAGFGMSYVTFPIDIYAYWNYPIEPSFAWNSTSSFGPALLSASTPSTLQAGFPALPPYILPTNGIIQVNTPTLLNQFYYDWNVHEPYPYVMAWNFAYEHALPVGWVLDVAYVGNRSVHSPVGMDLNASTVYGAGALGQPEFKAFGRTASTQEYFAGFRSEYDSLQVRLDHKFAKGFSVTTSYTYGKAIGYVDDGGDYPNNLLDYVNLRRNWAPTDFNQTHTLHQSFIWLLPFGKGQRFINAGLASKLLGGWEFSGLWQFATGFPLNFSCDCPAFNTPSSQAFPNINGPFKKLYGIQTQPWFDTSLFSSPAAGTQGNVGEWISSGPNFFNLDASIFRRINLTERFKLEIRSEWFHATNTPQFANPDTNLGDPTFGLVTSATGSRSIDFVGKLIF